MALVDAHDYKITPRCISAGAVCNQTVDRHHRAQPLLEVRTSRSRRAVAPTVSSAGAAPEHWLPSLPPALLPLNRGLGRP